MDPLHQKLKALKPDEPDDEIEKDLAAMRQARPGITDDEIFQHAQTLVQGGGNGQPAGVRPAAAQPPSPGGPSGVVPATPAEPPPTLPPTPPPAAPPAPLPTDEDLAPHGIKADDVGMAALQGLAGMGDVIGSAYGGQKTDFLKQAQGAEAAELAKRKTVADSLREKRGEKREERKLDLEGQKVSMEALKSQIESMKKAGKETFEMEEKLRDGFAGQAKTFQTVRDQLGTLQAAAQDPSAAGDLALIFSFMKLVDPGSTVREGEFANAQNAAGVPDQARNAWNRALSGQRLGTTQREDFVNQAGKFFGAHQQTFQANKAQYDALADAYGLDKGRVTGIVVGEVPKPPESRGAPGAGQPPKIGSQEEYDRLPPGSEYIAPDGTKKRKK